MTFFGKIKDNNLKQKLLNHKFKEKMIEIIITEVIKLTAGTFIVEIMLDDFADFNSKLEKVENLPGEVKSNRKA